MKCPACGRTMLEKGIFAECPNRLCDYEEEIEDRKSLFKAELDLQRIIVNRLETAPC
jgi:hypothetical protein